MTYREVVCSRCGGSGKSRLLDPSGIRELSCSVCAGTGKCKEWFEAEPKGVKIRPEENKMSCSNCGGTGKEKCIFCEGCGQTVHMIGGPLGTTSWASTCVECSGNGKMTCRVCQGTGKRVSEPLRSSGEVCGKCHGSGKVQCESYLCRGSGHYIGATGVVICSMCGGTGRMRCDSCRGMGRY